jgi:hypothetical protein
MTTSRTATSRLNVLFALGTLALVAGCATGSRPASPSLVVVSPQPVSGTVTIADAAMSGPGFVVIHATDAEGKPLVPGSIGATPIPGGESRNVAVALTEPVQPGDRLIAMLHVDSGQNGVYEFGTASIAEDKPVMHQGKPVTTVIVVQ